MKTPRSASNGSPVEDIWDALVERPPGLEPSLFWDPYVPGVSTRLDRMEEMNFFTDAKAGKFHPTTPELRIKDQDTDGIKGEVLYGVLALASGFESAPRGEDGTVVVGDGPSEADYGLTDPDVISGGL